MALGGAFLSADFPFYLVMRVVTAPVDIWCSSHPDRADERLLAGPGPSWGALAHLPQAASFLAQQEVWGHLTCPYLLSPRSTGSLSGQGYLGAGMWALGVPGS